jgi:hypothetical protein
MNTTICPRCENGWLRVESDKYGSYRTCFNCGYESEVLEFKREPLDWNAEGKGYRAPKRRIT